jgi:hypothetical protein
MVNEIAPHINEIAEDWLMRFPKGCYDEEDPQRFDYLVESLRTLKYDTGFVSELVSTLKGYPTPECTLTESISPIMEETERIETDADFNPHSINNLIGNFTDKVSDVCTEALEEDTMELDESFPALDPRTHKVRYFQKADKLQMAVNGDHPDHPGIKFIQLNAAELAKYKPQHANREQSLKEKKRLMIQFILVMKNFLKLDQEGRSKISLAVVTKFKVTKNELLTKVYVNKAYTQLRKGFRYLWSQGH